MLKFRSILIITFCLFLITPINCVFAKGWFEGDYLTGEWGGHREKLRDEGFIPFANFHMSVLGNPVGGRSQGAEYAGQLIAGG